MPWVQDRWAQCENFSDNEVIVTKYEAIIEESIAVSKGGCKYL